METAVETDLRVTEELDIAPVAASSSAAPGASSSSALYPEDDDEGSYDDEEFGDVGSERDSELGSDEEVGDDEEYDSDTHVEGEGRLVRRDSSFARLSADSWLTVVSDYEREGPNENLWFHQVEEVPLKDPEEEAAASEMHAVSAFADRSVLDCVVILLRGARAQKRKVLRRYGERWIWLGGDLLTLYWKSKRRGVDQGSLNLTKVKKLRLLDRELIVETYDNHKLSPYSGFEARSDHLAHRLVVFGSQESKGIRCQ